MTTALLRKKPIESGAERDTGLQRALSAWDLTLLGIGAIIGAGIFVLSGEGAAKAGPAVTLSFVMAGTACGFTALAYAELAAMIGGSGSAYGYAYVGFGELTAWVIGWDLILEYSLAASVVAIGWSGYVNKALAAVGLHVPPELLHSPAEGGIINLPAAAIILILAGLLMVGVRESARFNAAIVFIKLTAIAIFMAVAFAHLDIHNWSPFAPFGWEGVMGGAALIFFAYIGFDAVSTAADETRNPQRDLPMGIILSLSICTILYIAVGALLTGIAPYQSLDVPSPVADALLNIGVRWAAAVVSAGAIAGLTSVMLVMFFGQTRIFFAMSRDRLLPPMFAELNPKTHTPVKVIMACGLVIASIAGFAPISTVAELVNIGTLAAFTLVSAGVIMLRYQQPELKRPFRTPFSPVIPALGILSCLYLMSNLQALTWIGFAVWTTLGLIVYFSFSRRQSALASITLGHLS
ncbi:MAG TPA: amino acid permease [Gammaproteobacteria bacterium]|nr:amino acid permease [Gammaproteobacteria bacterium]HKH21376.1 amino acid permease [Gammaproteobacteria bacterium]